MNYYRCELVFDSVTGELCIRSDTEVNQFVKTILNRDNLLNTAFTPYSKVRHINYQDNTVAMTDYTDGAHNSTSMFDILPPLYNDFDAVKTEAYSSDGDFTNPPSSHSSPPSSEPAAELLSPFNEIITVDTPSSSALQSQMQVSLYQPGATQYFKLRAILSEMQQVLCKALVKQIIRVAIPAKKVNFPYKDGEKSRPSFWPAGVPHRQPDHMSKNDRINLIHFFLTELPHEQVNMVCTHFRNTLCGPKRKLVDLMIAVATAGPDRF